MGGSLFSFHMHLISPTYAPDLYMSLFGENPYILDYTCRARWPEGLLCSTISLKSCNLAQILQSPKSEIVTCVMFSTHTNTSLIKPHLTELDEIHRNRPKSNYNLAKNLQSWSVTSDGHQTDGQRFTHFLSGTPV